MIADGKAVVAILLLLQVVLGSPTNAYAYVDPGTGGLLLQLLLGGAAGLGVLLKLYWRHLKQSTMALIDCWRRRHRARARRSTPPR